MFLTTNRTHAIDKAFRSRMDLILRYADLDFLARKAVWENFLDALKDGTVDRSGIVVDELAREELNGREIKNLIKTANVLGCDDGQLTMEHLRTVLEIRKRLGDLA
jgi:SpoVK/Ycf46/Vps4 family AAA+-type ATPase